MMVGPMSARMQRCDSPGMDRVRALLADSPDLGRASDLAPTHLPVADAFTSLLPGLRLGSVLGVTGTGATSLALALVARASTDSWTAVAGLPALSLVAASELGVAIDRVVVVPEAGIDALAAVVDAFDLVVARPAMAARTRYRRPSPGSNRPCSPAPPSDRIDQTGYRGTACNPPA